MTVAFHPGPGPRTHTEEWRTLAWVGGDAWADLLCEWCDRQADPKVEVEALCTAAQLSGKEATTRIYLARMRAARESKRSTALAAAADHEFEALSTALQTIGVDRDEGNTRKCADFARRMYGV